MNILRALFDRWNADKVVRRLKYTPDELKEWIIRIRQIQEDRCD